MQKSENISRSVIVRLPRYLRYLSELIDIGIERISSKELATHMSLTASQIRQDLNCFGGFGQQGYGYNVKALHTEIGKILGVHSVEKAILIGAGNLGRTIASHINFKKCGFVLEAIFDNNPSIVGSVVGGLTVQSTENLKSFCKQNTPSLAVLCIPRAVAVDTAYSVISFGVKAIWNFSQKDLILNDSSAYIENIRLSDSLMTVRYHLQDKV